MDAKELADELINGASGLNMCMDGQRNLLSASGKTDMVSAFWKGIDFCLARNYPDLSTLKHFFLPELQAQHVYIDESVSLVNESRAAFLGDCAAEFIANEYAVSRLYVKHNSQLTVKASGNAFVMVDALDNTLVKVEVSGTAKVIVNLYSKARISGEGAKVVHKNRETYDL